MSSSLFLYFLIETSSLFYSFSVLVFQSLPLLIIFPLRRIVIWFLVGTHHPVSVLSPFPSSLRFLSVPLMSLSLFSFNVFHHLFLSPFLSSITHTHTPSHVLASHPLTHSFFHLSVSICVGVHDGEGGRKIPRTRHRHAPLKTSIRYDIYTFPMKCVMYFYLPAL